MAEGWRSGNVRIRPKATEHGPMQHSIWIALRIQPPQPENQIVAATGTPTIMSIAIAAAADTNDSFRTDLSGARMLRPTLEFREWRKIQARIVQAIVKNSRMPKNFSCPV